MHLSVLTNNLDALNKACSCLFLLPFHFTASVCVGTKHFKSLSGFVSLNLTCSEKLFLSLFAKHFLSSYLILEPLSPYACMFNHQANKQSVEQDVLTSASLFKSACCFSVKCFSAALGRVPMQGVPHHTDREIINPWGDASLSQLIPLTSTN